MAKVKPWVKIAGIAIGAVALGLVLNATGVFKGDGKGGSLFSGFGSGDVITVGTNTYAGFLPFLYLNGGAEPNEESVIYKEFGIKLKIVVQDDFQAGRAAFKNGDIDVIYCTADSWPVECGEGSDMTEAKFFNISNWSRGADAIVVNKHINSVADLKGKTIATSEGTASHTLLLNALEAGGIAGNQVKINVVPSGVEAAQVYKSGSVDACVCFSPDDIDLSKSGLGKILVSTKQASNIICDGLVAKQSWLDSNKEKAAKLIAALLYANTKMNNDPSAVKEAAKAFAKVYGTDEEFAIEGSKNIYYVTLEDEANFFGLNSGYTGIKGEELYSKMARTYSNLNLTKHPLSWNKVSTDQVIESLMGEYKEFVKGDQKAEKAQTFTKATETQEHAQAMSNKKLTIEFPTGSDVLDSNAKSLIDREFVGIAKQFSGSRIRIEGNTDNTGSDAVNKPLSYKRAKSVANYLIKEYGFDENRFIIVGNGSAHAIAAGSVGENQNYRTTDFQLINE